MKGINLLTLCLHVTSLLGIKVTCCHFGSYPVILSTHVFLVVLKLEWRLCLWEKFSLACVDFDGTHKYSIQLLVDLSHRFPPHWIIIVGGTGGQSLIAIQGI